MKGENTMSLIKYTIDGSELSPDEYQKLDKYLDGLNFLWKPDDNNPRCGVLYLDDSIDIESINLPELCHYQLLQ
jgi:hypothetical protein